MNAIDILNETPDFGKPVGYRTQQREACEYLPTSVEYIVHRAIEGRKLASDDMVSLREIAIHFLPGGSIQDFMKLHVGMTAKLVDLLDEAKVHITRRDYVEASLALSHCIELLDEYEFLRFNRTVYRLDGMLFTARYEPLKVAAWRNNMTGFDFTEIEALRSQKYMNQK